MGLPAPCPKCSAPLQESDAFCTRCGAPRQAPTPLRGRRRLAVTMRAKDLRSAARWILVLAGLFAISGTIMGFVARSKARLALANLSDRAADEAIELDDGTETTIGELREAVVAEYVGMFLVNYVLAAIYVALYFWARKSALPAMVTALCVFLALQVFNALVDPLTLIQGWLIKILCIVALFSGIRAALAERAAREAASEMPEPTPA